MRMTPKQRQVWRGCFQEGHRWNIAYGATRSGKTYLDYFKIPARVRQCTGSGLIMLLGNTQQTLERNILAPMRRLYGPELVGDIRSGTNVVQLFGREAYALGAEKINQVAKLQGSSIEYAYGDELATWHKGVFDMLKSRLDRPNSVFDGTCNPEAPTHWVKKFLDSDADVFATKFTIDDNSFNDPAFVENLKREYAGTVLYDRYILDELPPGLDFGAVGVDFGGNKSGHAFVFSAFDKNFGRLVTVADFYRRGVITPAELTADFLAFLQRVEGYGIPILEVRADSAEQVLIAGLRRAMLDAGKGYPILNAKKGPILDRIRLYTSLLGAERWHILRPCAHVIEAYKTALYDAKSLDDKRLDDGTTLIDPIDAQEYSTEPFAANFIARGGDPL